MTSTYVSLVPRNLAHPPVQWSAAEVKAWLKFCVEEFSLSPICTSRFDMNGKALCLLTRTDFMERAPHAGDVLHNVFQRLRQQDGTHIVCHPQFQPPVILSSSGSPKATSTARQSFVPILPQPRRSSSSFGTTTTTTNSCSDNKCISVSTTGNDTSPCVPVSMLSPAPSERSPSDSDSSCVNGWGTPYHDVMDADADIKAGGVACSSPCGEDGAASGEGGCRLLWEFVYQLLQDPRYSDLVCWESEPDLTFRINNQAGLADLWGQQKNKDNMTYEKLSRALRYYYKMNIIKKVPGRRLTYRFLQHPTKIRRGQRGARPHASRVLAETQPDVTSDVTSSSASDAVSSGSLELEEEGEDVKETEKPVPAPETSADTTGPLGPISPANLSPSANTSSVQDTVVTYSTAASPSSSCVSPESPTSLPTLLSSSISVGSTSSLSSGPLPSPPLPQIQCSAGNTGESPQKTIPPNFVSEEPIQPEFSNYSNNGGAPKKTSLPNFMSEEPTQHEFNDHSNSGETPQKPSLPNFVCEEPTHSEFSNHSNTGESPKKTYVPNFVCEEPPHPEYNDYNNIGETPQKSSLSNFVAEEPTHPGFNNQPNKELDESLSSVTDPLRLCDGKGYINETDEQENHISVDSHHRVDNLAHPQQEFHCVSLRKSLVEEEGGNDSRRIIDTDKRFSDSELAPKLAYLPQWTESTLKDDVHMKLDRSASRVNHYGQDTPRRYTPDLHHVQTRNQSSPQNGNFQLTHQPTTNCPSPLVYTDLTPRHSSQALKRSSSPNAFLKRTSSPSAFLKRTPSPSAFFKRSSSPSAFNYPVSATKYPLPVPAHQYQNTNINEHASNMSTHPLTQQSPFPSSRTPPAHHNDLNTGEPHIKQDADQGSPLSQHRQRCVLGSGSGTPYSEPYELHQTDTSPGFTSNGTDFLNTKRSSFRPVKVQPCHSLLPTSPTVQVQVSVTKHPLFDKRKAEEQVEFCNTYPAHQKRICLAPRTLSQSFIDHPPISHESSHSKSSACPPSHSELHKHSLSQPNIPYESESSFRPHFNSLQHINFRPPFRDGSSALNNEYVKPCNASNMHVMDLSQPIKLETFDSGREQEEPEDLSMKTKHAQAVL